MFIISQAGPIHTIKPDFVLKLESQGETRYLILDAKYSTSYTVREKHIPKLFENIT